MENLNIILFLCNWGPHAAYQELQDKAVRLPDGIKMVRIPCAGRISKALLIKPFEMGADGVALVGCAPGSCRYGSGTDTALNNVEDIRGILELLGLGKNRLRIETFLPEQSEEILEFLEGFHREIDAVGKSPVSAVSASPLPENSHAAVREIVKAHDIYSCQDCGKCSSSCSLTLAGKPFSPRAIAASVIAGDFRSPEVVNDIWACLTCGLCYDRCPSSVNFPEFIRDMRHVLKNDTLKEYNSHGGFFQSLQRTMASKDLDVNHWHWLPGDIKTDQKNKTFFYGGCAPYFDLFFRRHLSVNTNNILIDGLRLLNFFDIIPAILKDERCCGHDLLWSGDKKNFIRLAKLNVDNLHKHGCEELITTCPECYRTFSHDYPEYGIDIDFKVTHIMELLEKEIDKGAVGFSTLDYTMTFQDPCRLSRFEDKSELPRRLLSRMNNSSFNEMRDRGAGAICCGNCAWTGCDSFSKALQVKRLQQARETGSDVIVTACPKCQVHLRCAMEDPFREKDLEMDIMDLTSVVANSIHWE